MKPIKDKHGPEWYIQQDLITYLRQREWHVMVMHASEVLKGIPDLYCVHPKFRQRWIEVKVPTGYHWTPAQREHFHHIHAVVGIWVMFRSNESEYQKLMRPANYHIYCGRTTEL